MKIIMNEILDYMFDDANNVFQVTLIYYYPLNTLLNYENSVLELILYE